MIFALFFVAAIFGAAGIFIFPFFRGRGFGLSLRNVSTKDRMLALTFDDGPNEPYTSQLLDVLSQRGVRATFFLVGANAARSSETVRRIAAEGHEVGNHSWEHAFWRMFSRQAFLAGVERTQDVLYGLTGERPRLFRFPWLYEPARIAHSLRAEGLRPIGGVFGAFGETLQLDAERLAKHALGKARPGAILIFHDGYNAKGAYRGSTVRAMKLLLPKLEENGFRFVTVSELVALSSTERR